MTDDLVVRSRTKKLAVYELTVSYRIVLCVKGCLYVCRRILQRVLAHCTVNCWPSYYVTFIEPTTTCTFCVHACRNVVSELPNEGSCLEIANDLPAVFKVPSMYRGADKSLARPTSRCILFDG